MKLTRRDALFAVAAGSVGGGTVEYAATATDNTTQREIEPRLNSDEISILLSVSELVYPSEVTVTADFISAYVGLLAEDHRRRFRVTVQDLDTHSKSVYGTTFGNLSIEKRAALFREMGIGRIHPRRKGSVAARVRYFLVNGLLYALFTSPKGGQLFGIANPIGHPGGYHGSEDRGDDE